MRRTLTRGMVPIALAGALVLAGCGQDRATFESADPVPSTEQPDASSDTAALTTDAADHTGAPTGLGELVPIEWPDAPRELTAVEREFFFEPGPFAGDAYDEAKVIDAVVAMRPQSAAQWQEAIQSQLQGDYFDDVTTAITFDASLGEAVAEPTEGERAPDEATVGTNHFALVLDASGSMGDASDSGTRMAEAKEALGAFVGTLPANSTVSLRVYGHEGDNTDAGKAESCGSTAEVFSGPVDDDGFSAALDEVEPTGWTPLADAITAAADDLPPDATDGIVYVVTDGIETCSGDPVAAAEGLAESGIQPIVNVIGFQAGDADQEALRAIADAGGGDYTRADSQADLEDYWDGEHTRMMQAWEEWKATELSRIESEGAEQMADAEEVGQRLMTAAETEGQHAMAVAEALDTAGHLDYALKNEVWSYFYERKGDMWSYAYELKTDNWSQAYALKNDAWRQAYDKGNSKWSEFYDKKISN
ncbi:vWA domain-containing protein [Ornithinimicrobium cryptoxanthini]|uniref:vWA domain-containing protein n=1 Tax=Ornithinimicrobium cryptoxanthini TaxID=2934161 RepID=UPI002119A1BD|nr:VWA domain-containing protein [Ornithinimicrobium cryptoxanthini]